MLELRVHGGVSSEITDSKDRTILQYRNLEPDISIQSSPILLFEFFPSRYEFIFILPYENKFYPKIHLIAPMFNHFSDITFAIRATRIVKRVSFLSREEVWVSSAVSTNYRIFLNDRRQTGVPFFFQKFLTLREYHVSAFPVANYGTRKMLFLEENTTRGSS